MAVLLEYIFIKREISTPLGNWFQYTTVFTVKIFFLIFIHNLLACNCRSLCCFVYCCFIRDNHYLRVSVSSVNNFFCLCIAVSSTASCAFSLAISSFSCSTRMSESVCISISLWLWASCSPRACFWLFSWRNIDKNMHQRDTSSRSWRTHKKGKSSKEKRI